MNYETKRNVFEQLLNEHQNLISKDNGMHINITTPLNIMYDDALPDNLPTIIECVSKEIKDRYGKNSLLDELTWANQDALPSSEVSEWIIANQNIFACAWALGAWRVEETGEIVKLEEIDDGD